MIKTQISEELRQLDDEIAACKLSYARNCVQLSLKQCLSHVDSSFKKKSCLCETPLTPVLCVFAAFSTTGFDRNTSLVFNPANPETSVEDCLAAVGDRVASELDTHLEAAANKLLTGSVCSSLICL